MKPRVYVETTIISYLAAPRSRNLIVRAHQELTRRWWRRRAAFEVFASPLVVEEAGRGDVAARVRRRRFLRNLPLLEINDGTRALARQLLASGPLPAQAEGDALHIGVAAVHGMEYLVTWNCRHIANANKTKHLEVLNQGMGLPVPRLITPHQLQPWETSDEG